MGPGAFRRGRRRGLVVGAAVGARRSKRKNSSEPQAQAAPTSSNDTDQMAQLEKLAQLKNEGILTEEEFQAKKKQILGL